MILSFTIDDVLTHAVAEVIDGDRLRQALERGEQLRVKLGIDPTSPDIHLGRSVVLWKLRALQELGCHIDLIIGTFTGQVGDTSDKESDRPMLSEQQVNEYQERYEQQLWMVLNPERRDQVTVHRNGDWLAQLPFSEVAKLADVFSVNSFMKRELIARRLAEGSHISLREMLYPVMQGYDSHQLHTELELGGTDQRFNLLSGRAVQEYYGEPAQMVLMTELVPGLDGRKMSSSYGNGISLLDTPTDKYGKMMTARDDSMSALLLTLPRSIWPFTQEELTQQLAAGENPRDLKRKLAWTLVALYHGVVEADQVQAAFIEQFTEGSLPADMIEVALPALSSRNILEVLLALELVSSKGEARRLIEQGGVRLDSIVITDPNAELELPPGAVVQVGKRRFVKLIA
jgi:tyrosyl-tRNA synthetase